MSDRRASLSLVTFLFLLASPLAAARPPRPQAIPVPLVFEESCGQAPADLLFLARGRGFLLGLAPDEVRLSALDEPETVRIRLLGASTSVAPLPGERLPGVVNIVSGNDPSRWILGLATYRTAGLAGVYPKVDLVLYGNDAGELEHDFVVAPGGDPSSIRLSFEGARSLALQEDGSLRVDLPSGELLLRAPIAYQAEEGARKPVGAAFRLAEGTTVGFAVGPLDASRALVIDPSFVYATYLGGAGLDYASSIAVDASGNVYVAGFATTRTFPGATSQGFGPGGGLGDAFVAKLDASGSGLSYLTFLGGSLTDEALGITVDPQGRATATGYTESSGFPVTANAFMAAPPADRLFKSTDGGTTWARLASLNGRGVERLAFNGGSLFAGVDEVGSNDRDIRISTDGGASFSSTGYTSLSAQKPFTTLTSSGGLLFSGVEATPPKFHVRSGSQWLLDGAVLFCCTSTGATGAAVDTASGNLCGTDPCRFFSYRGEGVFRGSPSAQPYQAVNGGLATTGITNMILLATNPPVLVAGAGSSSIVRATTVPTPISWTTATGYTGGTVTGLAADPSNPQVVYATSSDHVSKSTDGGATWALAESGLPAGFLIVERTLAAAATNPTTLYVSTTLGVFRSPNAGATWEATGMTDSVSAIAADPASPMTIYAGMALQGGAPPGQAFVTTLDSSGAPLYSTFLGGLQGARAQGVAADSTGKVWIAGWTGSGDLPVKNAIQPSRRGPFDAFFAKLDPFAATAADSLMVSSYWGGTREELAYAIDVDGSGNPVLTGTTHSSDFPVTAGAYDPAGKTGSHFSQHDAFLTKLSANGQTSLYSTYLGEAGNDYFTGVSVNRAGNRIAAGGVAGGGGMPLRNAFQTSFSGGTKDGFVALFDPTASGDPSLLFASYLGGGNADEFTSDVKLSESGRFVVGGVYVKGIGLFDPFPLKDEIPGAPGTGNPADAYIALVDPKLSGADTLVFCSRVGGSGSESSRVDVDVDPTGNAYMAGLTASTNFPATAGSWQTSSGGPQDGFIAKVTCAGGPCAPNRVYAEVTGDGTIDVFDLIAVAALIAGNVQLGNPPFLGTREQADLNNDGVVDIFDLVLLAGFIVGNVPSLPV